MTTTQDKPKKSEIFRQVIRRLIDFTFTFKNKRGDLLANPELLYADGFTCSPQEFYATVEQQIAARKIPGLEISRVKFAEGGLLSEQRVYLRLMRERLCIDTCAAPFGNLFFFSIRKVYVPALVRLWHIVVAFFFFGVVDSLLVSPLGASYAAFATVALVFAIVGVLHNAAGEDGSDLDTLLLKLPVVSTIYEDWFRVETYYREDTRSLYQQLFPQFIQAIAEETCAAKGYKLTPYLQPPPPIEDLKKPFPPDRKAAT
ncbi:MAG: hypothetical protein WCS94_06315 [Verrucomicrobiota bacterium]